MTANSKLKWLNLYLDDLSSVDASTLAQAVTHVEEVGLADTQLTLQQVEAIFAGFDASSSMKSLSIGCNNLSSVDPDLLARVANKLETVDMEKTQLTRQQMTEILTRSLLATNLKELNMLGNGEGVEEELVTQTELVIKELFA